MSTADVPGGAADAEASGWTLGTLHAHLAGKFDERDRRYEQRFLDVEKALAAALATTDKALASAESRLDQRFAAVDGQFGKVDLEIRARVEQIRVDTAKALTKDGGGGFGNLPVPDPTVLTTQLVDRALTGYREVVETRLAAMDRAVHLVADDVNLARVQTDTATAHFRDDRDREIHALREVVIAAVRNVSDVTLEKFNAVDTRFQERDTRTQQAADESRISLDAALAAAKEAVSEQNKANTEAIRKSELATQKQIDSLVALMTTANKSVEDKISDLKTRLDRGEGQTSGASDSRSEHRLDVGQVLLIASVLIAMAGVIIAVVLRT